MLTSKSRFALSVLLASVFLTGCASKINESYHQQTLNSFLQETQIADNLVGQDEVNWWQQLGSEQLNQLVEDSLVQNNDLKTSYLQLESALAKLGAQKAEYLPQGGVSVDARRTSIDNNVTRQSQANLSISWQIDLFGRISALVNAANANAMSQSEQLRLLKIEVVSSVVNGFVSYQGNKQKQEIITQQVKAIEQSIDVLQARVDEGVATELDLNRTKAQLSQQQSLLPQIEYALYRDRATLALLTGRLSTDLTIDDELSIIDLPLAVSLTNPSNAIAMRPDISRALYDFSQANSLSVAASKALLPDVSLSGFSGVIGLNSSRFASTDKQWQIAPQIEWSLLSYPALIAQNKAQKLLSEAAYSEYQQVVLAAINESELALKQLLKEEQQQYYAGERFSHANNAFLQAKVMYEEGQIPYLDLLDARQDMLITQESVVDFAISSLLAKVNAYHAFNGRWSYAMASPQLN